MGGVYKGLRAAQPQSGELLTEGFVLICFLGSKSPCFDMPEEKVHHNSLCLVSSYRGP